MSNLGDYIGAILSEITTARVQADLQAVRVADLYATHPLLKAFPVPRFRLPNVTIDVPVAVSEPDSSLSAEGLTGGLSVANARKAYLETLDDQLKRSGVRLTAVVKSKLSEALRDRFKDLSRAESVSTSAVHVADSMTRVVEEHLTATKIESGARDRFVAGLRDAARLALVRLLPSPPRVRVVYDTARIRELGPNEFLTRVQLNISEQGVEWKGEDGVSKRLVPE